MFRRVCQLHRWKIFGTGNQIDREKNLQGKHILLFQSLKFSINPPTLFMWANRFMLQWDNYIDTDFYALNHPLFTTSKRCYFKKYDEGASYKNFRILMQLIDCALLDIQSSQYKNKLLVCAFMYLVLGKTFNEFKMKEIVHEFPRSSLYLLD
jgi:hypothetical protein